MTAKRRAVNKATAEPAVLAAPDDLPIEEWPGWDPARGVFVLDRSRTRAREAAKRTSRRRAGSAPCAEDQSAVG